MAAVMVEVAGAVLDAINVADFGAITFTSRRSYADWHEELPETEDGTYVDVAPDRELPETTSGGQQDWMVTIDVLVRRRFGRNEQDANGRVDIAETDALVLFVEQIWELFVPAEETQTGILATTNYTAAFDPEASRIMWTYVRSHMRRLRQFTGWVRLGFIVTKEPG